MEGNESYAVVYLVLAAVLSLALIIMLLVLFQSGTI
jgi:hypothetical protein